MVGGFGISAFQVPRRIAKTRLKVLRQRLAAPHGERARAEAETAKLCKGRAENTHTAQEQDFPTGSTKRVHETKSLRRECVSATKYPFLSIFI